MVRCTATLASSLGLTTRGKAWGRGYCSSLFIMCAQIKCILWYRQPTMILCSVYVQFMNVWAFWRTPDLYYCAVPPSDSELWSIVSATLRSIKHYNGKVWHDWAAVCDCTAATAGAAPGDTGSGCNVPCASAHAQCVTGASCCVRVACDRCRRYQFPGRAASAGIKAECAETQTHSLRKPLPAQLRGPTENTNRDIAYSTPVRTP